MGARILVAEDDPFNRRLICELCEAVGHTVDTAADGRIALAKIAGEPRPDLVLLDLTMPEVDGLEVLRRVRAEEATRDLPVILVTASGDEGARARGFEAGADDFVAKPFRVFELQQRIEDALSRRGDDQDRGSIDSLTRAGTARQLRIGLDYEFRRSARYGHPLSCIVVAVENLDELVSAGGRDLADGVLVSLAQGIRLCIRTVDHVYRSDLDEFTIVLPQTDRAGAERVAQRVLDGCAPGILWGVPVAPTPVIRVGVVGREPETKGPEDMLRAAFAQIRAQRHAPTLRPPPPESEPP